MQSAERSGSAWAGSRPRSAARWHSNSPLKQIGVFRLRGGDRSAHPSNASERLSNASPL